MRRHERAKKRNGISARRAAAWALLILGGAALAAMAGCGKKEAPVATSAVVFSAIRVSKEADGIHVLTQAAEFVLSANGYLRGNLKSGEKILSLDDAGSAEGQQIRVAHKDVSDFVLDLANVKINEPQGKLGPLGKQIDLAGASASTGLAETLTLEVYDDFPALALLSATFRNAGQKGVALETVSLQQHRLNAAAVDAKAAPYEMWSFFGSSLKWGKDDVLPIPAKFSQENPFGAPVETKGDLGRVGGGIPVVAFWTREVGEAIGHAETLPLVLSIPVETAADGRVAAGVRIPADTLLKPGEVFATPRTFLAVYKGDYYEPLNMWSNAVEREGLARPANNDENYAVSWCGWGYEEDVTPKQMLDTIPKLKELGIHWATLDDRWFNNYGDWQPRSDTFAGDAIQKMVNDSSCNCGGCRWPWRTGTTVMASTNMSSRMF
jgi:alpha-galactosidase